MTNESETRVMTCPHGHTETRRRKPSGGWSWCRSCDKLYRKANPDKVRAYSEANRERILAQQKAYSEANRERILAQQKAYREANRERILAQQKAYDQNVRNALASDDETILARKARKKAWHEANREQINAARREQRAKAKLEKEQRENGDK